MRKNKILFVCAVNSRKAGGLFFTISQIASMLTRKYVVGVLGYKDFNSEEDSAAYNPEVILTYYSIKGGVLRKLAYSGDIGRKLKEQNPDIIHQQGIWLYYSKAVSSYKNIYRNTKVVIQPHGMLNPAAFHNSSKFKRIAGLLFQNNNLKTADCLHALNLEEYRFLRDLGLKNPVAVIPNGITCENNQISFNNSSRTILYLGRLHPLKGIHLLVEAVKILYEARAMGEWKFIIAGWDQDGYRATLEDQVSRWSLCDYFQFMGPVFGKEKEELLSASSGFILPSFSEGQPMAVLEAWAHGLPVLMTEHCNLAEGFENSAAMQITTNPQMIAEQLSLFFSMSPEQRSEMGTNGYNLVREKFTWENVTSQTEDLYDWLLGQKEKPDFVFLH